MLCRYGVLGIVFDTQVGVVLSVVGILHFLIMLGVVFDTYERAQFTPQ